MKRIGILTSGGDAPGMNAAVRAVVRACTYYQLEVFGIYQGYKGLMNNDIQQMYSSSVSNILQKGGTILKSARSKEFRTQEGRQKAFENIKEHKIEGLIVIGGDGSFTGANIFYKEFGIPVIGVPGTIDNDIYGTDYTIGFDTAVNTALDAIDKIRDTADSHGRIFFIEVMGRDSGYIAIQSAIGGGAEAVILPEEPTTTLDVVNYLREDIRRQKTFSIIIVAEKDKPGDAVRLAEEVSAQLTTKDIRVTILGHIQRGGAPTAADRTLASRLGLAAVESLKEGRTDEMVGIIGGNLVHTPLLECIEKDKPLKKELLRAVKILSI